MLPLSTDPDIRRLDGDDPVPCPKCRNWMLPLSEFNVDDATAWPTFSAEPMEVRMFGLMAFVYNYLYDLITLKQREKKVRKLTAELLPNFPNTLICTQCLAVKQMR